jgi:hypothetical protein
MLRCAPFSWLLLGLVLCACFRPFPALDVLPVVVLIFVGTHLPVVALIRVGMHQSTKKKGDECKFYWKKVPEWKHMWNKASGGKAA